MAGTVLVTGGTGFVAGWCIVELLNRGYQVRTTIRSPGRIQAVTAAVAAEAQTDRMGFATADLTSDDGWAEAVAGCDYVLHVASPLGEENPRNADDLIIPARDGALRVLRAATSAGVKRVVVTSAANAASPNSYTDEGVTDETLWTIDSPSLPAYRRSKTLAERAAWDFMKEYEGSTTLATVLPGAVFGPILSPENLGSVRIIARMMEGRMPGLPKIGLEVVDVRDLADLHIRAMTSPEAGGERFLGTGEFVWMRDIAEALRSSLGDRAAKVPTRELPNLVVRAAALFDPGLRAIAVSLGRRNRHTTDKAQRILGWTPRPAAETVAGCAASLLERGVL
ncbi:SDR family oxidoreductase [Arthrobacter sp. 35W]|uniref:SDR family oxidoreductase n=1 Tax=Arthrobacter sp. 35W TaxID=1132441 RepID=UPI0004269178|nr:aldehyde reductase [Arthrobacter sp. 35W]